MNKKLALLSLLLGLILMFTSAGASSIFRNLTQDDTVTISREEYEELLKYSKLQILLDLVDMYYYEDVDQDKMLEAAATGLMTGLDDVYSNYFTPEQMEKITEEDEGNYAGIGCQLIADPDDKLITVTRVFKGSPADEAGIISGDKIVYVDDVYYSAYEMDEAVLNMRGTPGESVKVTVMRNQDTIDFDIVRQIVTINYVEYEILPENIGYVIIYDFLGEALQNFTEAVKVFEDAGVEGMIIDLRNNGGGFVDAAIGIADLILPEGVVVTTRTKDGTEESETIDNEYFDVPMAVLVNGYTASASEILSGAIRDYQKGTLIGTQTFGKGVIQAEFAFTDGSGVRITMARYYTPSGECIHGVGITPDIICELNEDVVTRYGINNIPHDIDNQLQTAIEVLQGTYVEPEPTEAPEDVPVKDESSKSNDSEAQADQSNE